MIRSLFSVARWSAIGWITVIILGCTSAFQSAPRTPEPEPEKDADSPARVMMRQVIVTLPPAPPTQWASLAKTLSQTYRLPQVGAFPLSSLGVQCLVFRIPPERSLQDVAKRLAADPRIESVQFNSIFQGLATVYNDHYAKLQYGAQVIRADRAHRLSTGKGVKIAVIDTGVAVDHPDLQGRIVQTANFVKGGEQTFAQDRHGTAVTGVIAARANNAIGIFGVAPEADIVAIKACREQESGSRQAICSTWALAQAIDHAILEQVQLLNLSLAGPPDPLLLRLLTVAFDRDIVVVAAAKEQEEQQLSFPASLDSVIAVLASDTHGNVRLASGATRPSLLAAPGVDILTTAPRNSYDFFSGSSLAAAHVSGIVALLLAREPTLSPLQLRALVSTTAQPAHVASSTESTSVGLVDACAALAKLLYLQTCP